MSRGHFERVREVVGTDDLLAGTITVAYLDAAAQNHSLVEGAPDPYPDPHGQEARGRARGLTGERAQVLRTPIRGVNPKTEPRRPASYAIDRCHTRAGVSVVGNSLAGAEAMQRVTVRVHADRLEQFDEAVDESETWASQPERSRP